MSQIERDRYGRPLVVPPKGGKPVAYTRATTFAGSVDDSVGLVNWKLRMVAKGIAMRPQFLTEFNNAGDDKLLINKLIEDAMDTAGANAAANLGTQIHHWAEEVDKGAPLDSVPREHKADVYAYLNATSIWTNKYIEQFCVLDKYKVAGTPDRIVEYNGELFIADIKTGSLDYPNKMSLQLAIYANALPYDIATATRSSWGDINKEKGIIIHLPAGTGVCMLHWIDIKQGWKTVQLASKVRQWRDTKRLLTAMEG